MATLEERYGQFKNAFKGGADGYDSLINSIKTKANKPREVTPMGRVGLNALQDVGYSANQFVKGTPFASGIANKLDVNLPQQAATGGGRFAGAVANVIPTMMLMTGAGQALKGTRLVGPQQQALGREAGRLMGSGNRFARLAGRGVANLSQGLPMTLGYQVANEIQRASGNPAGNGPREAGADLAFDFLTGGLPILGLAGTVGDGLKHADDINFRSADEIEKSLGWKGGDAMKKQFDEAVLTKDVDTVKKMLPDVPKYYKDKFKKEIGNLVGDSGVKSINNLDPTYEVAQPENLKKLVNKMREGVSAKDASDSVGKSTEDLIEIYHGTPAKFEDFDLDKTEGGVVWFTDNLDELKKGDAGNVTPKLGEKLNIMKRVINKDLKLADESMDEKYFTEQLQAMGYDGVKTPSPIGDGNWYRIWNIDKLQKPNNIAEQVGKTNKLKGK